jgi:hypothetical protein
MLAGRMFLVVNPWPQHQVARHLRLVHGLHLLEAAELGGGVEHHQAEDEQQVEPDLDQAQADADVYIVDDVLNLGFEGLVDHRCAPVCAGRWMGTVRGWPPACNGGEGDREGLRGRASAA